MCGCELRNEKEGENFKGLAFDPQCGHNPDKKRGGGPGAGGWHARVYILSLPLCTSTLVPSRMPSQPLIRLPKGGVWCSMVVWM